MDIKTILIIDTIVIFFMIIFIFIMTKIKQKILGIKNWLYSYIALFLGLILLLLQGILPNIMSIVLANTLLNIGLYNLYLGFRVNFSKKVGKEFHYAINIIYVIVMIYYTEVKFVMEYRIIASSVIFAIYFFLLARESLNFNKRLKMITFTIYASIVVLEISEIFYYIFNYTGETYLSLQGISVVTLVFHAVTISVNVLTMFTIVTNRLISKLERNVEKERESREKINKLLKEKEELVLTISHDLRTPLNGIMGAGEIALLSNKKEEVKKYIQIITKSSEHILQLIKGILRGKVKDNKTEFNIKELLNRKRTLFRKECLDKNILFFLHVSHKVPRKVIENNDKVEQILFNIIGNAIKYTNEGGVYVKATSSDINKDRVKVNFIIRDTGIGISDENIKKIYTMLYVENEDVPDSFGIGLYNTKKIIDSLGGEIEVDSKKGKGSTFRVELEFDVLVNNKITDIKTSSKEIIIISDQELLNQYLMDIMEDYNISYYLFSTYEEYLDIMDELLDEKIIFITENKYRKKTFKEDNIVILGKEDDQGYKNYLNIYNINSDKIKEILEIEENNYKLKKEKTIKDIPVYKKLKALILEDNNLNVLYMKDILEMLGIDYDIANEVKEANQYIKNNVYNIIFSDINLKKSNGIEFVKGIRQKSKAKKVAITAGVNEAIRKKCYKEGFDEFIEKPYSIADIIDIIEKYFSKYKIKKTDVKLSKSKKRYYKIFLEDINKEIDKIHKYNKQKRWEDLTKIAHKIKGGASILNEIHLIDSLFKIEEFSKIKKSSKIEKEIEILRKNVMKLEEWIQNENSCN